MSDLLTSVLAKVPNAVTNAPPAVALIAFAGSPSYHMAFKGQKSTDQVYFDQAGPIANTLTDAQPALAAIDVFLTQALILAWKVAGKQTVEVRQYTLGEDGFPVSGSSWVPLTTTGGPANPAVQTDTAPALAIGANSQIYLAWKTPGPSGTVNWSVYDGQGWSAPAAIPQAVTDHAPAFAGWNTSGPGNVLPLCLAWKQASGYGLFWSSFLPGATNLSVNQVPGVATDAAPALTPGQRGGGLLPGVEGPGSRDDFLRAGEGGGDGGRPHAAPGQKLARALHCELVEQQRERRRCVQHPHRRLRRLDERGCLAG